MFDALRAWLVRIDYKRFTHRGEVRYLSAGLVLLGSLAYAAPAVIEQGGVPPAGSGQSDVRIAMFTAVTAFLTVAGQLILLARAAMRRAATRAALPPHKHPEILDEVEALRAVVDDAVERLALVEGQVRRSTDDLYVLLAQTQRMVEGMRVDAVTRADYTARKIEQLVLTIQAERRDRQVEREERIAAARETSEQLSIIANALGLAAAAGLKPAAVVVAPPAGP